MRHAALLCSLFATLPASAQTDHYVGAGGHATLAHALQVVQPGDRILIGAAALAGHTGVSLNVTIPGDITIESDPALGFQSVLVLRDRQPTARIVNLTSTTRIVLRNIRLAPYAFDDTSGLILDAPTVVLENVSFVENVLFQDRLSNRRTLLEVRGGRAQLSDVEVDGRSPYLQVYTVIPNPPMSVDAAVIHSAEAFLERCKFVGGHADIMGDRTPAQGGRGLVCTSSRLVMNDTLITDGDGSLGPTFFPSRTVASLPGYSSVPQHAIIHNALLQWGARGDQTTPPLVQSLGDQEPLIRVDGGQLGADVRITVFRSVDPAEPHALGFVAGLDAPFSSTPFGMLVARPDVGVAVPSGVPGTSVASVLWPLPVSPGLLGTELYAQTLLSDWTLGGTSWATVHR